MFDENLRKNVAKIIDNVRNNGDRALSGYSLKFDGSKILPENFKVNYREIANSGFKLESGIKKAIENAASNILFFHKNEFKRLQKKWVVTRNGISAGQYYTPVESAGVYVSGGVYAFYPSIILMCVLPARVAGVKKIVMATPPRNIVPEVLYAAKVAGVTEIYKVGGAHAVAALAFGTRTIPKVDFIAGPGSKYVTEAKRQVFGSVGIDLLAGPSEIAIICDSSAGLQAVAADLLAQAEHSPDSKCFVFSDSPAFISGLRKVMRAEIVKNKKSVPHLSEKQIDLCNLKLDDCISSVNRLAPEHLEIIHKKAAFIAGKITNAGAVFIGKYSPVALGDYYAGPSHILPTAGTARFSSGLSVMTFLKRTSIIRADSKALRKASGDIINLAESEKLKLHAGSVRVRLSREGL